MKRLQAFKYTLMPNGEQQRRMRQFAGACRFVFNKARGNVEMPIYQVWIDSNEDLKESPAMVYACALEGFGL